MKDPRRKKPQRWIFGLLPLSVSDIILFAIPMGFMVCYSFWVTRNYEIYAEWTIQNYVDFFTKQFYFKILFQTIWISAIITILVLVLAYPFSYFLARYTSKWQKFLLLLVVISFWTSSLLRAYAWITILGSQGLINTFLMWTGLINQPLKFLIYSRFNVIIVGAYFLFPFAVLTLFTSLEKMDFDLVRAAMDLGATPARAFWYITIPETLPGIFTAIIFVFVPSLGFYIIPAIVGGTTSAMMANLVGSLFRGGQLGMGAASSFIVAIFIGFVLAMAWRRLQFEKLYRI